MTQANRSKGASAMPVKLFKSAVFALAACVAAGAQTAQAQPTIKVGDIKSEKQCTYYQNSAGSAAVAAGLFSAAAAVSWRTWWVKDCVNNFATFKNSLETALASSGKLAVASKSANYVLSGRISAEGTESTSASGNYETQSGYDVSSTKSFVTMDATLTDSSGRKTFGVMVTKKIDTSTSMASDGTYTSSESSGQGVYAKLQDELALAVARKIAFHITPLIVSGGDGDVIQLNYGAPFLQLGTTVQATSPDGRTIVRYNVIAADSEHATAEVDGDGRADRIVPGSTAIVIEADDPAANGRRMKRVELP